MLNINKKIWNGCQWDKFSSKLQWVNNKIWYDFNTNEVFPPTKQKAIRGHTNDKCLAYDMFSSNVRWRKILLKRNIFFYLLQCNLHTQFRRLTHKWTLMKCLFKTIIIHMYGIRSSITKIPYSLVFWWLRNLQLMFVLT